MQNIPTDVSINVTLRYLPLLTLYNIKNRNVHDILLDEAADPRRYDEAIDLLSVTGDPDIAILLLDYDPSRILDLLFGNKYYDTVESLLETMPNFDEVLNQYLNGRKVEDLQQVAFQTTTLGDFLIATQRVILLEGAYPNIDLMLNTISRYQRIIGGVPEYEWYYLARYVDLSDSFERYLLSNPTLLQAYRERLVDPDQAMLRNI